MTTNLVSVCELIVESLIFEPEGNERQSPIVRQCYLSTLARGL